jgi:hypothetical protein
MDAWAQCPPYAVVLAGSMSAPRSSVGGCHQHADAPHSVGLLRARRERPNGR